MKHSQPDHVLTRSANSGVGRSAGTTLAVPIGMTPAIVS
jgi:hypothetical protein